MKRKIISLLLTISLVAVFTTGCGNSKKEAFEKDFIEFTDKVAEINTNINSIDSTSESAPAELLAQLDELNKLFTDMAAMEFPAEYDYLYDLATESGQFMNEAVTNYHAAFEGEYYDSETAALASSSYDKACKRLNYMITFMRGETPETNEISYK